MNKTRKKRIKRNLIVGLNLCLNIEVKELTEYSGQDLIVVGVKRGLYERKTTAATALPHRNALVPSSWPPASQE